MWQCGQVLQIESYLSLVRKCNRKCSVSIGGSHLLVLGEQRLVLTLHYKVLHQAVDTGINVLRLDVTKDGRSDRSGLGMIKEEEEEKESKNVVR